MTVPQNILPPKIPLRFVLIIPFIALFDTVQPERVINLIAYTAVLVYSGGLAVYYLFINPQTRFGT